MSDVYLDVTGDQMKGTDAKRNSIFMGLNTVWSNRGTYLNKI